MFMSHLKTFLKVAKLNSFSLAAKELHITQPSVSLHINALEDYYGCKLLERNNKRVSLTPAGLIFKKRAEEIMNVCDTIDEEINGLLRKIKGNLFIGASLTIGEYFLPGFLKSFYSKFNDVKITMIIENTEKIIEMVNKDELEIGLVEGLVNEQIISSQVFSYDEMVVVSSQEHEMIEKNSLSIEEFLSYPIIIRERGSGTRNILENSLLNCGYILNDAIIMELGSTQAIKNTVKQGLGISVLSKWTVLEEIASNIFNEANIEELPLKRQFKIVQKKQPFQNIKIKTFINELINYAKCLPKT